MSKIKLIISNDYISFKKGGASFSIYKNTTVDDLKLYFKLAGISDQISNFRETDYGWEFFNNKEERAFCTHEDLINKLKKLKRSSSD